MYVKEVGKVELVNCAKQEMGEAEKSDEEIEGYKGLLKNNVNLIMELSKKDCNV